MAFNGRLSSSSGLYARQTVRSLSVDTLNIMTVVQLFKWDTLTVALRSNTSYEILEDSTFSVVMHGKSIVLRAGTPEYIARTLRLKREQKQLVFARRCSILCARHFRKM